MATVAVELTDNEVERLADRAKSLGMSPSELLRIVARQVVDGPDTTFTDAAAYVLKKNSELYERLG